MDDLLTSYVAFYSEEREAEQLNALWSQTVRYSYAKIYCTISIYCIIMASAGGTSGQRVTSHHELSSAQSRQESDLRFM